MEKDQIQALITESIAPLNTEIANLREAGTRLTAENKALKEAAVLTTARGIVADALRRENALPVNAKERVLDAVLRGAMPLTESGSLDEAKLATVITEAVKYEATYLADVLGSGNVRGMGSAVPNAVEVSEADVEKELKEYAINTLGLNEADATRFAKGRQ